jgi:hypothetical protein
MKRLMIILALTISSAGCGFSIVKTRHVSTVSVVSANAVLVALHDGQRALVCGTAVAPAPPLCIPVEVNRTTIAPMFITAFDLDGQVARTVRGIPAGGVLPSNIGPLLAQITQLINRILAAIPKSVNKQALAERVGVQ